MAVHGIHHSGSDPPEVGRRGYRGSVMVLLPCCRHYVGYLFVILTIFAQTLRAGGPNLRVLTASTAWLLMPQHLTLAETWLPGLAVQVLPVSRRAPGQRIKCTTPM